MRYSRLLVIPFLLIFVFACNLASRIPQVETQVQSVLTSAPTLVQAIETAVYVTQPPSNCPSTPTGKGLGLKLEETRSVMQASGQFTFTDGVQNGQPIATAKLSSVAAQAFPAISGGFSADFIGDPCNLSEIKITIPRNDNDATVNEAIGLMTVLFAGVTKASTSLELMNWLTSEYAQVPVGGREEKTIDNIHFTLSRDQSDMFLDAAPAQ